MEPADGFLFETGSQYVSMVQLLFARATTPLYNQVIKDSKVFAEQVDIFIDMGEPHWTYSVNLLLLTVFHLLVTV